MDESTRLDGVDVEVELSLPAITDYVNFIRSDHNWLELLASNNALE